MAPKPHTLSNPFVQDLGKDTQENLLGSVEYIDVDTRLEDIISGAVDSYRACHKHNYTDIVNKHTVFQLFKHCDVLSAVAVRDFTGCAVRQSQQYMRVLKTCVLFVQYRDIFPLRSRSGYIDITRAQMHAGYLL